MGTTATRAAEGVEGVEYYAPDRRFRVYVTEVTGEYVAEGWTDGDAYWLVDTSGNRISEFLCNRAQVTLAARRRFGRLAGWDVMRYGHPAWRVAAEDECGAPCCA